jgi:site-specific recombinase XerC
MHALRHFYASVLLDAGESIRALAEYWGTPTRVHAACLHAPHAGV